MTARHKDSHRREPMGMPTPADKASALAALKLEAAGMLFEPRGAPVRMVRLDDIEVAPKRMRALRPATVDELVESIQARGLLQPIVVRPRRPQKDDGGRYWLVTGRHRFEAVRKLEHDRIAATILDGLDADAALLAEIDENLIRADLSPAERAAHVARRKGLYERLHPETRQGGQPGAGRGKKSRSQTRQNGDTVSERFTKDTAKKTGKSERAIQRDAQRGKDCAVLDDIVGTSLDKGDELDALAKLSPDEQAKLAEQAKSGEKVSAKKTPTPTPSARDDIGPGSADEASPDKAERDLARLQSRLQELQEKTRLQESTILALRSEVEEAKAAAKAAPDSKSASRCEICHEKKRAPQRPVFICDECVSIYDVGEAAPDDGATRNG